jgi:hypothetical protein
LEWIYVGRVEDHADRPISSRAMDQMDIPDLASRAERLGWSLRVASGVHVIDLLVSATAPDIISALAESRDR